MGGRHWEGRGGTHKVDAAGGLGAFQLFQGWPMPERAGGRLAGMKGTQVLRTPYPSSSKSQKKKDPCESGMVGRDLLAFDGARSPWPEVGRGGEQRAWAWAWLAWLGLLGGRRGCKGKSDSVSGRRVKDIVR